MYSIHPIYSKTHALHLYNTVNALGYKVTDVGDWSVSGSPDLRLFTRKVYKYFGGQNFGCLKSTIFCKRKITRFASMNIVDGGANLFLTAIVWDAFVACVWLWTINFSLSDNPKSLNIPMNNTLPKPQNTYPLQTVKCYVLSFITIPSKEWRRYYFSVVHSAAGVPHA